MSWFFAADSQIRKLVSSEAAPPAAMDQLVAWCAATRPHPDWARFDRLGIAAELPRLERWLHGVLRRESPATTINAYWFGLFNPCDDDGTVRADLYVAGSSRFTGDIDADDWNVDPEYWPESRYAGSRVLATIYRHAYRAGGLGNDAEYPLTLGYAAFAVAHLCRTLEPGTLLAGARERVATVGFDSGDMLLIGTIHGDGFQPAS